MSPAKYIQPNESAGRKWKPLLYSLRGHDGGDRARARVRARVSKGEGGLLGGPGLVTVEFAEIVLYCVLAD